MRSIQSQIACLFAVVTFGIGLGLVTYVVAYSALRSSYLGRPPIGDVLVFDPGHARSVHELQTISTIIACGVGALSMSIATFILMARSNRSKVGKVREAEI